jgi:hypothetical protein
MEGIMPGADALQKVGAEHRLRIVPYGQAAKRIGQETADAAD